jgi:hypothetical protein
MTRTRRGFALALLGDEVRPVFITAALAAFAGFSVSFSRGLAAVAERTPARTLGLRASGIVFATSVGVLALACLAAILWQGSRQKFEYGSAPTLSAAKNN